MIDDVKFKEVEKKVIDQFKKMKLKDKCSDAEMVVKGIVEKDLAKYFKDCLKISNCGIVNEDNELCVSLNKEAIERLRSLAAEVNIEKD
jgi:protein-arginine kinase